MISATGRPVVPGLRISLAGQIVLLATCIAAATACAFAVMFHLHLKQVAEERHGEQLASSNRMLLQRIEGQVATIAHDHEILARSVHVSEYIDGLARLALTPGDRDRRLQHVRLELAALLNATRMYTRIRLMPVSSLADGTDAVVLSKVSEPDASAAWEDAIARTTTVIADTAAGNEIAMIAASPTPGAGPANSAPRIASLSPLYNENGRLTGIIAIEADYRQFLDKALEGHQAPWGIAIVDANGNYRVVIPGTDTHGTTIDDRSAIAEAIRALRSMPDAELPMAYRIADTDSLAKFSDIDLGTDAGSVPLRIASIGSRDVLHGELLSLAQVSFIIFTPIIVISAALGMLFGRRVAAPLRTMSKALLHTRRSSNVPSLPVDRKDEIGDFARSFTSIIDNLRRQMEELDRGNTDLKATNSALATANEEIRGLTHIISHDLRAPLVNLMGFSEELARQMSAIKADLEGMDVALKPELRDALDSHVPKILGFIEQSATKMEMKLDVVLNLARLGRYEIGSDPVNIQEYFEAAVANHIPDDDAAQVSVELQHVPVVRGDRQAAEVFAQNLIGNAYKYRDPSRPLVIKVTAEMAPAGITLSVEDNGRGIARQDEPRVFKLFGRAGKQDTAGQGVGLSYCKALLKRVDGEIWFESEVGVGSKFFVFIPATAFKHDAAAA